MLSTVQPKVQGVAGVVLVAPKPFSFLKIKSATGGGGARRALAALGPNNAQHNMTMAKSHLANTQEVFSKRWNFNPLKEVPLAPGRFQWAPLIGANAKDMTPSHSGIVVKDITKPVMESDQSSVIPKDTDLQISIQEDVQDSKCTLSNCTVDQENSENEIKIENKSKHAIEPNSGTTAVPMKNVTSNSQNCITDFFRQKKRKSGYIHDACIPCPNTPPKKKARAIH